MQLPVRKAGKYTNHKVDPHITIEKRDELVANLERMEKYVRPRLAKEVKDLAANGDFSENAEYQIAKGRLRGLNQRILDTRDLLKRAIIIGSKKSDRVEVGSTVTVAVNGREKTYLILGSTETDPTRNIISHISPIGSALLGQKTGDTVTVKLKEKEVVYRIISIQ